MKNPSPVLGEFLVDQGFALYFGIMKSFHLQSFCDAQIVLIGCPIYRTNFQAEISNQTQQTSLKKGLKVKMLDPLFSTTKQTFTRLHSTHRQLSQILAGQSQTMEAYIKATL